MQDTKGIDIRGPCGARVGGRGAPSRRGVHAGIHGDELRLHNVTSILLVINDVLFVLIVMELLWTVIRYLKRQEFSLKPFLAIGIISSLRRILMVEAQMSMDRHTDYYPLAELGVSTGIVLVLVFSYYLMTRVEK